MSKKDIAPGTVSLRYIGGCNAKIWKSGWINITPGTVCVFPDSEEQLRLETGLWEQISEPIVTKEN